MQIEVFPSSRIKGDVLAPPSKSAMQRACALALLNHGQTTIINPGYSNDDKAALNIIVHLGANIIFQNHERVVIESQGVVPQNNEINCGESGLSIRMFTPLVALANKEIIINGSGSLVSRPMDFFDTIFPTLNVDIQTNSGKLPLVVRGELVPKDVTIDGSLSSQFLTGLILAYVAAKKTHPVTIKVNNLKSKPYIDLTLDILKKFGVAVEHHDYCEFIFNPEMGLCQKTQYVVEGDWSGGAFLLVAGAINGEMNVRFLDQHSTQGDKNILRALQDAGAIVNFKDNLISVKKAPLKAFDFDATDCPDLFPPLVVLAVNAQGLSTIKGVNRLLHKESNRALTLQTEFQKLGYQIELDNDYMRIYGSHQGPQGNQILNSWHDHRIAMACTIATLNCKEKNTILNAEAISKSFPDFYDMMKRVGVNITN